MKVRSFSLTVLILATTCVTVVKWNIKNDVNKNIQIAQQAHPVEYDDVAALIKYVNCDEHLLETRNHAVWTLGQIGDKRATRTLKSYYNGEKCDHAKGLCQKELKKAIVRCEK